MKIGGTHIDIVKNEISEYIVDKLKKLDLNKSKIKFIYEKLIIFMKC